MDFVLTTTQHDIQAAARRYLTERYGPATVAELADSGRYAMDTWPELVRQGWLDPHLGVLELALLAEENGRALHPVPWWATVGQALPAYHAALCTPPGSATLADGSGTCTATKRGGWRLTGRVTGVVDAREVTEILVAARLYGETALFRLATGEPGIRLLPKPAIDPLRGAADLVLLDAPARLLIGPPTAAPLLASIRLRAAVLLAAEGVGVAERALSFGVDHAKQRIQFGRPIGSYQAVSHPVADCYADLELARSLVHRAAAELDEDAAEPEQAVACAVHAARHTAVRSCETAIQVCGGIGVTWEFPLHRWYRRALWLDAWHAAATDPLATVAAALFDRMPQEA